MSSVHLSSLLLCLAPVASDPPPSRALLLELTAQPRLAGTIGSKVGADIVAKHLKAAGFEIEIDEREVMLSIPRRIELEIFESGKKEALHRRNERFDPDAIPPGDLPPCNAWSASGEVRAQVVDVGRGLRADFERVKAAGVDVKGKIALARYGGAYRGIKVDLATQYECVGVLLFHEKSEGEAWPAGPWKPGYEAERGSISPMGRTPGDPSTPGWPSPKPGEKAKRLEGAELAAALPTIPCIPIGWAEAKMLTDRMPPPPKLLDKNDSVVGWEEAKTPPEVRILVDQPRDVRTIRNVIATLKGASEKCVIAGAHRDAWVRGAHDDGTGVVVMIRAAQQLAERVKAGWKPPHSVVIALWDAEEFGMIGSTEWAEARADWVTKNCFAYVNSDVAVSGTHFRGSSGTPGMLRVLKTALERVPAADAGKEGAPKTLWDDWVSSLKKGEEPAIQPAGSGSDFAVFLHHLSRPVVDIGLSGNRGGQYHTAFDDFAMVERYIDPGFVGHEVCARLMTELLAQLAEQGPASFDYREAARALAKLALEAGQGKPTAPSWLGDENAKHIADFFSSISGVELSGVDVHSSAFYEGLAVAGGIPGREWYRNPIWTPGLEDGYGSEMFPILHARADLGPKELERAVRELVESIRSSLALPGLSEQRRIQVGSQ